MFEHYVATQGPDDVRARRLAAAGSIAVAATLGMGMFAWAASKMSVRGVSPPSVTHMLVQLQEPDMIAAPPPPAPSGSEGSDAAPEDSVPEQPAPLEQPINEPERAHTPAFQGDPNRDPTAPRCVPPSCFVGQGSPLGDPTGVGRSVPRMQRRPPRAASVKQPLDVLRTKAVFAPDPDPDQLRRTRSGMFGHGGVNRTHFCVDVDGRVTDVRTTRRFRDDPDVDRICRETVSRWRFDPVRVGDRARKTCGVVSFRIDFAR